MRNYLILIVLIASIGLFLSGCAVEKTYTSGTDAGMCMEITTSDAEIQADLEDAGFEEGTCSSSNEVANCDVSMPYEDGGDDVDMTIYFYSPDYNATTAGLFCALMGGSK